ncbi:retrovirus-related pol polyprotein LINE-1 [Tanacetum coccineum]
MPGRSSVEAIHLIRSLMEKYMERQRDMHMAFLDLEKAYDSVPRELIWKTLVDEGSSRRYIKVIRDMYDGAKTRVRTSIGNTEFFPVDVISPYLFTLILDELSKEIQEDIPWCLIFADDIVLVSESAKDGLRRRGRHKLRWEDRVKHDMKELLLSEDMTSDRNEYYLDRLDRWARIRLEGFMEGVEGLVSFGLPFVCLVLYGLCVLVSCLCFLLCLLACSYACFVPSVLLLLPFVFLASLIFCVFPCLCASVFCLYVCLYLVAFFWLGL